MLGVTSRVIAAAPAARQPALALAAAVVLELELVAELLLLLLVAVASFDSAGAELSDFDSVFSVDEADLLPLELE